MNILLIKPPLNPHLLTTQLYEPLELEYLAASVKNHHVKILDMRIDKNLIGEIKSFKPRLVGITAYTSDYNVVVQILRQVKNLDNSIRTVVGGHHATFLPNDFALPFIDAVFLGYSDQTFPQYLEVFDNTKLIKKIPNIGVIENGQIYFTKKEILKVDLDALPLPERSLVRKYHGKYHDAARNKMALVMTSRGCPFRCTFCACWKLMQGKFVTRTPESIVEELKTLPDAIKVVYFSDDNTFCNIKRMRKLCQLIKENNIRKKLQMYARVDTIVKNPELFHELKNAGLQFVTVGFESFQDKDLKFYSKQTTIAKNNQAIQILKEAGIYILAHFIVKPEYTTKDFNSLFQYIVSNHLFRPVFPVLTPLPGTELYADNINSFQISNYDYFDFAHSILPTNLSPKDFYYHLAGLYAKSYSVNRYLKYKKNQLFSLYKNQLYNKNTDGINLLKLFAIYFFSKRKVDKLRKSYMELNHKNIQQVSILDITNQLNT